jgi:urease accessory protein
VRVRLLDEAITPRAGAESAGTGRLRFTRVADRTVATRAFAASPLKLLQPRNGGHAAWVYASTYGGGLVDGDRLSLDIDVGAGAAAVVSTQASTKIYRSPAGTTNTLTARVGDGGLLAVLPDPVVCFAGASCRQAQTIDLAPDAALVFVDWITSGRRALGERWKFDNYEGRVFIRRDGRPIVYDALVLKQEDGDLAARLGRFNAIALVTVLGPTLVRHAEDIVSAVAGLPVAKRADTLQTASFVGDGGCVFRAAGVSVESVGHVIRQRLAFLPRVLGDDPWTRKW